MAELSLSRAKRIINATLTKGKALGFNPLSVVVLDSGGHVKAFERQDGASPGRFAIAQAKAYGVVMLGWACRAVHKWLAPKRSLILLSPPMQL